MSLQSPNFERITLVGLGLIGGSWALALKRRGIRAERVGSDRPSVLKQATACGAIHRGSSNLATAARGADLVILATPVGTILHHLDVLKSCVSPHALITDVGSTKWQICERARAAFENGPLFLGGHPLAGRECSGFANADAKLFDGATYVLSPHAARDLQDPRVKAFERLIRAVGARPFIMDASEHDRAAAFLSHLPQLVATALASAIIEETLSDALPLRLAASGFRDMTRLAESPYSVWRDICQTNREKIEEAVEKLISKLRTLKRRLATPELEKEFEQARRLRRRLEKLGSR